MSRRNTKTRNRIHARVSPRDVSALSRLPALSLRTALLGGLGLLFIILALNWYLQGGAGNRIIKGIYSITASAGLRVNEVFVTGRKYVSADALDTAIGADRGDPILAFDLAAIHQRLTENPWIKDARVERHLPNVLYVAITERVPFALWQFDQKLHLVDADGNIITTEGLEQFNTLPLLVGTGANVAGAQMLQTLDPYPEFGKQMKALVRVSDRRWDIELETGTTIKLPEENVANALDRLSRMWTATNLATRRIKVIDARLPDRIILDGIDSDGDDKKS